eukprot:531725_1
MIVGTQQHQSTELVGSTQELGEQELIEPTVGGQLQTQQQPTLIKLSELTQQQSTPKKLAGNSYESIQGELIREDSIMAQAGEYHEGEELQGGTTDRIAGDGYVVSVSAGAA